MEILKNIEDLDKINDKIAPLLKSSYYYASDTSDEKELWIIARYSPDTFTKRTAINRLKELE